jgi:hypothetical protein
LDRLESLLDFQATPDQSSGFGLVALAGAKQRGMQVALRDLVVIQSVQHLTP